MKKIKSTNKLPYILLLVIHSVMLFFTFYKNKDRKRLLISLLSNIGLAYLFEYFVVNLFHGYTYRPGVLKNKNFDKIVGSIFSQDIYVPFTALFLTAFRLGWKYKLLLTFYFGVVEVIYVRLGIYTHHWWKTIYTIILLPIYFFISDKWYNHLEKRTPIILFFSLFHLILVSCVNLLFFRVVGNQILFGRGSYQKHFILAPLYSILLSLFTAWQLKDEKRFSYVKVLSFRLLIDFLLKKVKWLKVKGSNFSYHVMMILLSIFYRDLVYKK